VRSLLEGRSIRSAPRRRLKKAETLRTCRQLLKVEPALWLFVTVSGLEPTNNAAERAIRPAVLWRLPALVLKARQVVFLSQADADCGNESPFSESECLGIYDRGDLAHLGEVVLLPLYTKESSSADSISLAA
jgi:hypothetical protein